jgi:hypothetical protein
LHYQCDVLRLNETTGARTPSAGGQRGTGVPGSPDGPSFSGKASNMRLVVHPRRLSSQGAERGHGERDVVRQIVARDVEQGIA